MFPASFVPYLIKLIAPELQGKIANHIAKVFKLPQLVNYMELPNDVDQRVDKMETQIKMLAKDSHPEKPFDDRISALEKKFAK